MARLLAAVRRVLGKVETPAKDEREEYQRELMYHLLAADPGRGFKLFRRAHRFYQLRTCALLLQLVGEQVAHLSADDRLWLRFHQGQLAQASAQWPEAWTVVQVVQEICNSPALGELKSILQYSDRNISLLTSRL